MTNSLPRFVRSSVPLLLSLLALLLLGPIAASSQSAAGELHVTATREARIDDGQAGVWAVPAGGGDPRRIIAADPVAGPPILVAVSASDLALLYYPHADPVTDPTVPVFATANLETGSVEPIQSAQAPRVWAAAFSPDGTRLLVVSSRHGGDQRVAVRDLATGEEQDLPLPAPLLLATHFGGGGVTWASNDLVFAPGPARSGVLLNLAAD